MLEIINKKVLITGGAGFIGSNLCENFLNHNNYVVCLDNLSTGKESNIKHLFNNKKFKFINGDIRNINICIEACKDVEIVLHNAALGSVPRSLNDPITTNDVNISGFLNMLIAARDTNVKRFVYAASSSTYGDSEQLPKIEDVIGKPLSPYAVTKYVNELYAHVFYLNFGLESIGLRYFNVYGRRQDPNGVYAAVIPKFINSIINLESPIINGDGNNSRDFTYIDNVIQMNHLAASTKNPLAIGQVFNTAVGESINLIEMFNLIQDNLSLYKKNVKDISYKLGSDRPGDIKHSLASIDKAVNFLGYKPTHNFEQGIYETVKWYINNLN